MNRTIHVSYNVGIAVLLLMAPRAFASPNFSVAQILNVNLGTRTGTLENSEYPCHATVERDLQGKQEFLVEAGWSAFQFPGGAMGSWSLINDGRFLLAETYPASSRKGVRMYFEVDSATGRFQRSIRKDKTKKGKSQICEFY